LSSLPLTDFCEQINNPAELVFAGKVPVFRATAYCYFRKEGITQHIIHLLKYKNNQQIGIVLGELLGAQLSQNQDFNSVDFLIPLPLHKKRKKTRGYNQSEIICKGIANVMPKQILTNAIKRVIYTSTQTKKSIYSRYENLACAFELNQTDNLEGKHLLLVDDVLTTGSSLSSAIEVLMKIKNIKISVACIAFAGH
jgi:ComF family protein